MIRWPIAVLSGILGFALFSLTPLAAQPLTRGPLMIHFNPQVLEPDRTISWQESLNSTTESGRAVVISIDAENLAIRIAVTPFVRPDGYLLVVQDDVRQTELHGVRRSSSVQSLQVKSKDPIAFFPLGRGDPKSRQMVVFISVEQ